MDGGSIGFSRAECTPGGARCPQEVYLRLLRVEDHETIRNPQAYLYTIANHVLYQHTLRNAEVKNIARVVINGRAAGMLWRPRSGRT
jgi:hypothetical protein